MVLVSVCTGTLKPCWWDREWAHHFQKQLVNI